MALKGSALQACGSLIPDGYQPPAGVLFPYGHCIADVAPPHVRHLFKVPTIAKFESDLELLCRHWRPLRTSELDELPLLRGERTRPKSFILSFDDGMREVYDTIAPLLRKKGIAAVFFLNSATIDNQQLMWRHKISLLIEQSKQQPGRVPPHIALRPGQNVHTKLSSIRFADGRMIDEIAEFYGIDFEDYLRREKPYLTTSQVLELSRAGFDFGAHSHSHPFFNEISVEDQKLQMSTSVAFVRSLGLPCKYFAFPFTDDGVPLTVFNAMPELGVTLCFGTSEARLDSVPFSFQRFALDGENANLPVPDIVKQLSVKSLARRWSRTERIRRH